MNIDQYISTADLARVLGVSRQAINKTLKGKEKVRIKEVGTGFLYEVSSLPKEMRARIDAVRTEVVEEMKELKPSKDGKDIGFEKELWAAADRLRGNIDSSEYKHVVLGLLFLKYVSDSFYHRREELERRTSDPKDKEFYVSNEKNRSVIIENKDYYQSAEIFYIPEKARWEYLRKFTLHDDIGEKIDEAMAAIERTNTKQLKDTLFKRYSTLSLDEHMLGELVNIFSRIKFDHDLEKEKDTLGRVYEYFLGQFASAEGKRGGEFFTPRPIVKLLVEVLKPYENARIFDPACGSGGMFVQCINYLRERHHDSSHIPICGQESNITTYRLCKMNLAIRGIFGNIENGNSYYDDKFPDLRADFVIANPPFNAEWDPKKLSDKDPRTKYGVAATGNANFMWIEHFVHHLAPNGMAGFVMANGALAVGGKDGEIRKKMIEADLVDIIIACPPKLFYNVALPVSLWFMSKNKKGDRFRKRTGETLFIDARELFQSISRKQVTFSDEHIKKIVDTISAWRGEKDAGKYKDILGFCKSASLEEIVKNGHVLTPGRYVGVADEIDDGIPFEEKMAKLSKELDESFEKGRELEKVIQKNLKDLGFKS